MSKASRVVATALGVSAALLGVEHGYFESRQSGPTGFVANAIGPPCDRGRAWHACEPALTVVRHFPLTGWLSILVAVAMGVWATAFVTRRRGAVGLALLVLVLFLVGGGFVTLLYGGLAAIAAARSDADPRWWRTHVPRLATRLLAGLWPWLLVVYLAWAAAAWVVGALSNTVMLWVAPVQTALTPVLVALIVASGIANDRAAVGALCAPAADALRTPPGPPASTRR
jgi:hypothetical protein